MMSGRDSGFGIRDSLTAGFCIDWGTAKNGRPMASAGSLRAAIAPPLGGCQSRISNPKSRLSP